ncbi:MAG: polysaccharide deacetylase family protein [Paludibacter sp.]|nr:polysaccharide deacetylase family protein [Paludibacter sp.]
MKDTIQYIIKFLLNENPDTNNSDLIGYTNNAKEFSQYKVVIKPSGFFDAEYYGTNKSLPELPLKIWEETPLLFGEPVTENLENTIILHADLIASSYCLISRYEEWVRKDIRDSHGRFPGKESLPYRAGFIDRPLVDEYGKLLRNLLRQTGVTVPEPPQKINKIYLTHDIDQMAHYRKVRSLIGGLLRGIKRRKEGQRAINSFFGSIRNDPWYTFPFLFKVDNEVVKNLGSKRCETIAFFRSSNSKRREDKPVPNLIHPDHKTLIRYCKRKNVTIGLHTSYEAGIHPQIIAEEKQRLEKAANVKCYYNRNHFLCSREPIDMLELIECGITDDFTIGYADMAGFRLGTCRPVKWINLGTKQLFPLTLHPLAIMDITLNDKRYMYMNAHDAYEYCIQLIDCIEKYNGEVNILWHNNSVEKSPDSYHRKLYKDLIKYLQTK